ncbi:MAG: 6-bladed beta-propeller [Dehalococcoidia bacterium]|nr:6-bladed beta-propeller [Dehalococcoidia bacterium]
MTTSIAAFAGLQWKPRVWGIAFAASAFVYLSLMTSLWTNLDGLISGPWGSLDYWYSQQDAHRGDQPWFYYYMLMPAYEFLPLVLVIGGAWWSVVRGDAFSRFLVVWLIGIWGALSWGAEKMPWLNVHIALPACILAAWTVQRAWQSWSGRVASRKTVATLGSTALLAAGGLALVAFLPGGLAFHLLRGAVALAVVAGVLFAAWPLGRSATAFVTVVAVIGALTFFSLRTMVMVVYERGDVPKDLLIYTQSSPQLKDVADQINALAAASGQGYNLPIAVDTADSFAWPWAWYLRDFKSVSYADFSNGPPAGNFSVMLVAFGNVGRAQDYAASNSSVQYGSPQRYPHRWWYDETYKYAMSVDNGQACLSRSGNCGPFRLETWKVIGNGIFGGGWLDAWFHYWRDHSPIANRVRRTRSPSSRRISTWRPASFPRVPSSRPGRVPTTTGGPRSGSLGSLPGQFFAPVDVEADADGNLYVIDSATKKLQKFDPQGNFITSIDIRNNAADSGEQSQPWGLGIGPDGEVVVADTFGWRVRVYNTDLELRASFGDPPDTSKAPGPFDLFGPRDAAVDSSGNVWVTDTGNDRIQVFTLDGQFVRTIGSSGSGPGQFDEPVGIDIGPDGAIYVADMYNSRVQVLNPDGTYRAQFTVEGWGGIEVNDKPYLRVLSDGRVAASVPSLNLVRILGADGALSATISSESEPLNRPYGMVESADGKLWIAEGGAARLRLFDIP